MKKNGLFLFSVFLFVCFCSCHFVSSFKEENKNDAVTLTFDKNKASVDIGSMEIINLTTSKNQNSASIKWSYDSSIINAQTDNYSAIITGLQPGTTSVTASCGDNSVTCFVTVSSSTHVVQVLNPYVYTSTDYVQVKPSETVRISASLFGGTAADLSGFSWTIDKPSVADISVENNYCWITGRSDGIAKLSVKHNRASYGYSVLVNCSSDGTNLTYISTDENVITINKSINDTADFAVELVNPIITEYASGFTFKIVDSFGTALNDSPVIIKNAGYLNVTLQARKAGDCFIRCSHPDAAYDMDILVRVIEDASDTYIEPSQTLVMVSDSEYSTVTLKLANDKTDNPSPVFTWEFSEGASSFIDYTILNGNQINTGDRINIKGKRNGTVKITVSSPGAGKRDIIVLCRNLNTSASDANIYITTSQNYIRMTKGDSPTQINVTIKNLDQQFVDDIHWKITNDAEDGSDSKVIDWQTGTGSHTSSSARSVLAATASAYCIIEPLNPGTAYIDISHPKASYPTRITVVVKDTVISEPEKAYLDFKGSPLVFLKNGDSTGISINFKGNGNENDINWEVTEGSVTVSGNACECAFVSPEAGSGASSSTVRVSHPSASNPLVFTIFTFDEYEQLNDFSIKNIYSCDTYCFHTFSTRTFVICPK